MITVFAVVEVCSVHSVDVSFPGDVTTKGCFTLSTRQQPGPVFPQLVTLQTGLIFALEITLVTHEYLIGVNRAQVFVVMFLSVQLPTLWASSLTNRTKMDSFDVRVQHFHTYEQHPADITRKVCLVFIRDF